MNLSAEYLEFLNQMVPPLIKSGHSQPSKEALYARQHYRKHHKEIRLRKLLIDIAVTGRVPKMELLRELDAEFDQVIKSWLQFRNSGKHISVHKANKMRELIMQFAKEN